MSTPLTPRTYAAATRQYERYKDPALSEAEKRWEAHPSEETFRAWVAGYGPLFFGDSFRDLGRRMILEDRTSHSSCLALMGLMSDAQFSAGLLDRARRFAGTRLFLAGQDDKLYPMAELKKDAESVPMPFYAVPDAGHFPLLENRECVAQAFERAFGKCRTQEVS